jgi:hypothetical protein
MWTAVHHRRPRQAADGLRHGAGAALPHPVQARRGRDLVSADRRTTPTAASSGMMGDDGEKFGAWPGTFEYCWSNEHWVDRMFERDRGQLGVARDGDAVRVAGRQPPTTARLLPHRFVRRDDRVGPAAGRDAGLHAPAGGARERELPAARFLRGGFWRNYMARYREINDLHKQMLRVSDKVEAMPAPGRAGAMRARAAKARPRPPLSGPVERLLLARSVRRHLHRPHADGHAVPSDRGRGSGRRGGRRRLPAASRTARDSRHGPGRASTKSSSPRPARPSWWTRPTAPASRPGICAPAAWRWLRPAAPARGLPRAAGRTRAGGRRRGARRAAAAATPRRTMPQRRSTTSSRPRSPAWPRSSTTTATSAGAASSTCSPPTDRRAWPS